MAAVIVIQLFFVLSALGVIVTGLRAIRADIQRLIDVQQRPSPPAAGPSE